MSELPEGIDPEIFEDLNMSLAGLTLCHILNRPAELAIADSQLLRFETELLAAEARAAIEEGDFRAAGDRLAALHRRRGGMALRLAEVMARWAPRMLSIAYSMRRMRLAARAAAH